MFFTLISRKSYNDSKKRRKTLYEDLSFLKRQLKENKRCLKMDIYQKFSISILKYYDCIIISRKWDRSSRQLKAS